MHQCPFCVKSFPSPYKLQRHLVIHTGQKPFICTVCGKAFTQSDHLKTHLQKVHQPRLPADGLQDGIATHNQQANCDKPAAGVNTHGSSDNIALPWIVLSSAASQPEWKRETVANKLGNPPKSHVNKASVTRSRISNVINSLHQEQAYSANVGTSVCSTHNGHICKVCLRSFTSSLQLWVHSATHNKPEQFERGRESKANASSGRSKITVKHQCPKCLKTFCSPSKLQRHFLIHTGQKPFSCMVCGRAFTQKVHLKSHLNAANECSLSAHTERKKQRLCNTRQTSGLLHHSSLQQCLTSHPTPVNPSVELELQCQISVNAVQDPKKHKNRSDEILKSNQVCKSNEQKQRYSTHKDMKPFQCMICNRSFKLEINLIRHHKIHRNQNELGNTVQNSNQKMAGSEAIKPLPEPTRADDLNIIVKPETWSGNGGDYSDCFPLDSELIPPAEQQRETGCATRKQQRINQLHQCHACLKCFPSASKLQRHMMTHTGQRPFGCETCGKRFRQKTHLRVHCRTHLWSRYHKQRSLYINRPPSRIGEFTTITAADVAVQEMLLHKKDFEAHTGSDVVSVKHVDQTPAIVIIQNDQRETDNRLLPHISKKKEVIPKVSTVTVKRSKKPGSVQHKCFQCSKCFPSASKLQRHEMVHTGLKPFQCVLCGKAFRQAPHLKVHERSHRERKPPKPVNQHGNMRKLKANNQQKIYPRVSVCVPQQNRSVNADRMLLDSHGSVNNGLSAWLCTRREMPITKVNSFLKTNSKSKALTDKKKLHTCHICFKNFMFPYKLSRHMVIHSGVRLYKCTLCGKTFTQRGHLKAHEHRCKQGSSVSHCIQGEIIKTNHLQDKCTENSSDCTDCNVDATREQTESHYTSVGHHSFADGDVSYRSEAMQTEWLAEEGSQEEENESEKKQRDDSNKATYSYDQPADHCSYSFPSELTFEMNKLIQNQNIAALPSSYPYEGSSHSNRLLSDEHESSVAENKMQTDDYWCEPQIVFECDKCCASFKSEHDFKQHISSVHVQPKITESVQKNRCDVCLKHFVSPSKLTRHYLIHTGQRPFRCDICGKTFTQSSHVRTHRLTH